MSYLNTLNHSSYIKFYPTLQSAIGSDRAALIFGKLEFFFSNPKFESGFYKFSEPCDNPLYRKGDSWSEELGISRRVFNKAFDLIGTRHKSKFAYLSAEDRFQGKAYASYHDRATNRTYYIRNHDFVSQFLEKANVFKKKSSSSSEKKDWEKEASEVSKIADIKETSAEKAAPSQTTNLPPQGCSWNGQNGRSYASGSLSFHKKTSSLKPNDSTSPPLPETLEADVKMTEEIVKIWNEEIGELGVRTVTKSLATRLNETVKTFFNESIESWKDYCQTISSSKFLMGEAQNKFFKKAWITWAIREENINRIMSGDFRLGDRPTNRDKEVENINVEINELSNKKEIIEEKIKNIQEIEQKKRNNTLKEKIKSFSEEEMKNFEKEFEDFLEKENNAMTEEFRKNRWKGLFVSTYFDDFVEDAVSTQLFKSTYEEDADQAVSASGLLKILEVTCEKLAELKQKKKALQESSSPSHIRQFHDRNLTYEGAANAVFHNSRGAFSGADAHSFLKVA
ncbi:MAG: hypothetical protein KBD76_14810 [Bacteriovorax sp.]|nr:hypothetical protein [Bacteriovorax sp.]